MLLFAVYSDTQKRDLANRKRTVDKTETEVGDMERELVENVRFCREKERELVTSLEDLSDKLNDSFSTLAERRGFAGCVNLLRGQDDLDFDGFGIEICVKARLLT